MLGKNQGGNVRHSPFNKSTEGHPKSAGVANMASKRSKQAAGFWPDKFWNVHLSTDGLQRTMLVMQESVLRQVEADRFRYSSSSSKGVGHPGRQTTNTNQLWDEHIIFLDAILSYLSYGRGNLTDYY